jgi:hypothetical protein
VRARPSAAQPEQHDWADFDEEKKEEETTTQQDASSTKQSEETTKEEQTTRQNEERKEEVQSPEHSCLRTAEKMQRINKKQNEDFPNIKPSRWTPTTLELFLRRSRWKRRRWQAANCHASQFASKIFRTGKRDTHAPKKTSVLHLKDRRLGSDDNLFLAAVKISRFTNEAISRGRDVILEWHEQKKPNKTRQTIAYQIAINGKKR